MDRISVKHVFGPVPSRRLGYSLGIDLVPYKTCSFDCIYCQLGNTTNKTTEIKEYFPIEEIVSDIKDKLKEDCRINYITLSGAGEPTLYSRISEVIDTIKKNSDKPVAVLTNGSMLWNPKVRNALMEADVVIPSLDAGNEEMFQYINRPCKELSFEKVVLGIELFIREFKRETWLEVFLLLKGVLSEKKHIKQLADIIKQLKPYKTQLNTIARPSCEKYATALSRADLNLLRKYFSGKIEVIANFKSKKGKKNFSVDKDIIINLLTRRPCTSKDISDSLSINYNETVKLLETLCSEGILTIQDIDSKVFYKVNKSYKE
jgi:wyosine [tRNA(Phe)-imidazoG37] synthetase (radical SAM superfamily)